MATTYHAAIQKLYVAYFNRPADVGGLNFWETVLEGNNGNLNVVAAAFAAVPEYTTAFAGKTNAQIVAQIYLNLFGHEGDAVGMKFWVDAMAAGNMTVSQAVKFIADGAQGTDAEIVENKVIAATAFTAELDTPAEQAGYAGAGALTLAKAFLAGVTSDATLAAATTPAALSASVAAVVKAGTPFTLEGALASLNASLEAKSDFLSTAAEVDAIDALVPANATDAQIQAAIGANLTAAASGPAGIDALIAGYSTNSASLRAAKVAVLETQLTEALTAAEKAFATDTADIAKVVGLSAAIAASEAAADVAADAAVAASLAVNAEAAALANAKTLSGNATIAYVAGGVAGPAGDTVTATVVVAGVPTPTTLIEFDADEEAFVLAAGATEAKYAGITAYLNAINASVKATAASSAAATAATDAALAADWADVSDDGTILKAVAAKMIFSAAAIKDIPTFAEIKVEQALFADKIAALNAIADAQIVPGTPGDDYADALAALTTALDAAATVAEVKALTAAAVTTGYLSATDKTAIDAVANVGADAVESAVLVNNNFAARQVAFNNAVSTFAGAEALEAGIGNLAADAAATELAVENAEKAITALEDALAAFEEAAELQAGVVAADAAIAAANKAFVDNKIAAPVVLDGGIKLSTAGDDLFIAGSADTEVRSAGILGKDLVYVGTDNAYNATVIGAGTGETALTKAGNVAALEFFLEETATGVKVYIETEAYGSETGDFVTINLVGVDLADITVANGFITVA